MSATAGKANPLINTECPVPVDERCCAVTLARTVQTEPAIREIRFDTAELELKIDYDPGQLAEARLASLAEELAHYLEERTATCRDRDQVRFRRGCGICVQQLQRRAREGGTETRCDSRDCSALALMSSDAIQFRRGVLRVPGVSGVSADSIGTRTVKIGGPVEAAEATEAAQYAEAAETEAAGAETGAGVGLGAGAAWAKAAYAGGGRGGGRGAAAEMPVLVFPGARQLAELSRRLGAIPREPLFVAITLLTLIAGAVGERTGPPAVAWGFYLTSYVFGGYFGVRAGFASLRARRIDIDFLMVLAAVGAAAVGAPFEGALLLFLFSLSNVLQDYALDRTRSAIKALSKLRPDTALVLDSATNEHARRVPVKDIAAGTLIQVRPGDRIALDGTVESGASTVDQSSITGESMPVEKRPGNQVLSGSINQDGELVVRVTKTSSESTIAKVITLVEEAQEQQARTERFLERFEQYYAVGVIIATILAATLPPYLFGTVWTTSVYRAITLLVAASPCALIISTPASILSSIGNGARRGILFKGGVHVEQAAGIQAVAFDKTGTLTEGKPRVAEVVSLGRWSEDELLTAAASLESKSGHVLAAAITGEAQIRELEYAAATEFKNTSGVGIRGVVGERELQLGSPAILEGFPDGTALAETKAEIDRLQREGRTAVVLLEERNGASAERRILGLIGLEDRLRPGVREVIRDLREAGIRHVVMLTGDNRVTAEQIAKQAGIDVVFPELLPENKLDAIRQIEAEYGPTAMVGDGVNDAPALAGARLGIAMGAAGTDVALETADVVLLSDDLEKIPYLIALSRRTKRTLITNIAVAMSLIALMIVGIYTIDLPLPLAVIGHEGGTVLVSLNGVRLLMYKRSGRRTAGEALAGGSAA